MPPERLDVPDVGESLEADIASSALWPEHLNDLTGVLE